MRMMGMVACLWMLGAPACAASREAAPAEVRPARHDRLGSPADSAVRAYKARLGARSAPVWMYIIDGVPYGPGTPEVLSLDPLRVASVQVLKRSSHGGQLPHLQGPVVVITTRR